MKKIIFFIAVLFGFSVFGGDNGCVTCIKAINAASGAATCCLISTANKAPAPLQPCFYGSACICGTIFCVSTLPVMNFKKLNPAPIIENQPRKHQ